MPLNSIGAAMTTFAAQNLGARKYDRIRKGALQGMLMAVSFALVMGVVFIIAGSRMSRLFLRDAQEAVDLAGGYLRVTGCFYWLLALLFAFRQTLQGLGNSIIPTIAGIMELVMRTVAALALGRYFGFTGICFASPMAFAGGLIPIAIAMAFTMKKLALKGEPALPLR
jgi:Na+-driven multidrug efflux pump